MATNELDNKTPKQPPEQQPPPTDGEKARELFGLPESE